MSQYEITFKLSIVEKIIFRSDLPINKVHCCSEASIYFIQNNYQFLLDNKDSIRFNLECFVDILVKALNNELILPPSIIDDIGYIYNQYKQGRLEFETEKYGNDNYESWFGYKYLLWGYEEIAWVYNKSNDIILEITPKFPNNFELEINDIEKKIENSAWYDEWIKDYKPILITTISRETAQQWLDQANCILKTIEENIKRMQAEGKF